LKVVLVTKDIAYITTPCSERSAARIVWNTVGGEFVRFHAGHMYGNYDNSFLAVTGGVPDHVAGVLEDVLQAAEAFLFLCGTSSDMSWGRLGTGVERNTDALAQAGAEIFQKYTFDDLRKLAVLEENHLRRNNKAVNEAHWAERASEYLSKVGATLLKRLNSDEFRTMVSTCIDVST
jgi:hypothetical protein